MLNAATSFTANMLRAWRLVFRAGPALTIASLSLVVLQSSLPLFALYLVKLIVEAIATAGPVDRLGLAYERELTRD